MSTAAVVAVGMIPVGACVLLARTRFRARRHSVAVSGASGDAFLLDVLAALLEAGRHSSRAVLHALDGALRTIDPSIDSVLAFVPAGDELACTYARGTRAEHFAHVHLPRIGCGALPSIAAACGRRAIYPGGGNPVLPNDRSALAMPMHDGRALACVVYVSSHSQLPRPGVREAVVRAIERAALPYAIAVEREADRADATHDGLTGLLSPRAFRRQLHDEFARARTAGGTPMSLWFVDTDDFKAINDRFGHQAGDRVLQAMASLLRAHLDGQFGVAARNGGDEFCALLRGTGKATAIDRAATFCEAVRAYDFGIGVPVTVSVGVATYPYDAPGSSALLEAADAAMYWSKREGRDRVSFATDAASFASLRAKAGEPETRRSSQWRCVMADSSVRLSS